MEVSIIPLRRWPGMEEDSATLPVLYEIETEDFDLPMSVSSSIVDLPPDPLFDKLDRYLQSDSFSDPCPLPAFAPPPDPKRARSCPDHAMLLPEFGEDVPRFTIGVGGVTAQSVAARERRKRISEKTSELGRLVPGGHRMSTSEMFQAAASYVRFLQAQVGMLSLLQLQQETCSALTTEGKSRLQQLITSTPVQEKLYRAGRCIVPKRMVDALVADRTIKSHPTISRDLSRFRDAIKCSNSKPLDKKSS